MNMKYNRNTKINIRFVNGNFNQINFNVIKLGNQSAKIFSIKILNLFQLIIWFLILINN